LSQIITGKREKAIEEKFNAIQMRIPRRAAKTQGKLYSEITHPDFRI
jgi:hypothetical protein